MSSGYGLSELYALAKLEENDLKDIPSEIDMALSEYISDYRKLDQPQRDIIVSNINIITADFLLFYSQRMATDFLRTGKTDSLVNGIYALEMIYTNCDPRDMLVTLSLYDHASHIYNVGYGDLAKEGIAFSKFLSDFSNRPANMRTIECMGHTIVYNEKNEPTYQWRKLYK